MSFEVPGDYDQHIRDYWFNNTHIWVRHFFVPHKLTWSDWSSFYDGL